MKVHFTTLGCPKNQVDSELMLGMLTEAGHQIVEAAEGADCLVVNTCAFIDRAREESVNTILELAHLKARGRARALIVTGCLTQRYGLEISKEIPEVSAILGTSELHRIVDLVNQADGRQAWVSAAPPGYLYDAQTPRLLTGRVPYAYVKIAEGCDMGCTFCAIPQFRGKHRSRPLGDIAAEVSGLARRGIQEAILVSQDTLAYGRDLPGNGDIGDLLLALSDTPMPWIRPMYLHPAHVTERLIEKWRRARVVPYLDMPVQHGDDAILRAMRRGVTEAAFENLLAFVEDVAFDRLGVFTYSVEEGTPAADMPDQVPAEVMAERAQQVQDLQDRLAWPRQKALFGTRQTVLVDGPSPDPAFPFEGRTAGQAPEIDGVVLLRNARLTPGRFADVGIVEVDGYELVGE